VFVLLSCPVDPSFLLIFFYGFVIKRDDISETRQSDNIIGQGYSILLSSTSHDLNWLFLFRKYTVKRKYIHR
jgi:hypothetical protein